MLYMLLIRYDPGVERDPSEPASLQPQHAALEREMRAEGIFISGAALMPPEFAPILRVRRGAEAATLEGPFVETKELLGGYYIVDCPNAEEAARQAARIPVDSRSWIDVQPIALFHADMHAIARRPGLG